MPSAPPPWTLASERSCGWRTGWGAAAVPGPAGDCGGVSPVSSSSGGSLRIRPERTSSAAQMASMAGAALLPRRRGSIASLLHPAAACMAGAAETASMVGSRGHVDGYLHCLRICPPWLADPWQQWRVPARRHGGGSGRIRPMAAARGAGGGRSPPLPPHLPHAMAGLLEVHRATSAGPDLLDLSRARLSFFPAHPLVPLPPPDAGVGGRGGLRRPPPRAMADRDGLRSVPWRATSSSAGRIRTRSPWQSSWRRPAAVVPRTCSTHYLQYPAPQNAGQPGGQCRRHPWPGALRALLFRQGRLQMVDRVSRFVVRRASRRLSVSDCLSESLRIQIAPRLCSLGQSVHVLGQRHGAAVAGERRPQPHPCISLEAVTCMQLLRNRSCCIKPPARSEPFLLPTKVAIPVAKNESTELTSPSSRRLA
ncbi:uncharacterized protein LOC120664059 [Panicum virgatum]|uniref:Uncharacterized protein n=1 Tax=Panicum virgatum TaxID=38727 RepID=A0A8T0U147_PANVG|nr:uncharacterized protein LOC120664059 [Panicum virgatum]XP_039798971.1 uncharacterized protein LOC120664059 [Panicum virgatum]XP_039798972.1 uncharacterized protein LOC120664059 [Panicum virgatum]XP_039798973.1 uncharacterized protein LOC120664059 [Panicum virgatum]XP_039798974.1 uncharacterized protein LOC120664059 [Panicum virgatum]XP_039798975.1 uncharacterized protein LOC120664059 [Panicum virgatum]XP_039798976.1 uncharacterized protein LOC120664059 [Panicum virgatum]XP_039798977.1 unc